MSKPSPPFMRLGLGTAPLGSFVGPISDQQVVEPAPPRMA